MSRFERLHGLRPANVDKLLARASKTCLLSAHDIFPALHTRGLLLPCFTVGYRHLIAGLLRAAVELDAVIGFQVSPEEGGPDGGFTGQTPKELANAVLETADHQRAEVPLFLHADRVRVTDAAPAEIDSARKALETMLHAGFTSFGIDASARPPAENVTWTGDLSRPSQELNLGLEVTLRATNAEEAAGLAPALTEMIDGLAAWKAVPDLVALDEGPETSLAATRTLAEALRGLEIGIVRELRETVGGATAAAATTAAAAAGIATETWPAAGIRKVPVRGLWRRLVEECFPKPLLEAMQRRAEQDAAPLLHTMKHFKRDVDNLPEKYRRLLDQRAYEEGLAVLRALGCGGSAQALAETAGPDRPAR